MNVDTENKVAELRAAWQELKKNKPTLRIRDAAEELGVSEAELLATTVGDYTTRLTNPGPDLLNRFPELGRVMSLTRNASCVLEHKGSFQKIEVMDAGPHKIATVIGPIETRVFFAAWKHAFAVQQQTPHGLQQSIQVFDEAGDAVTKVFLTEPAPGGKQGSNKEAFSGIVSDFTAPMQGQSFEPAAVRYAHVKPLEQVDKLALLNDWANMKDTHDFFGMLRKHQAARLDAVKLAEGSFTERLENSTIQTMLEKAAQDHLPIMVFTGNRGNLQIHQGKVQTIRIMDNWVNILDPDFNMHLRQDHVNSVWAVEKPTTDGVVTGIEVFDAKGEMIVQFFGLRKPGIPELEKWTSLVKDLPRAR